MRIIEENILGTIVAFLKQTAVYFGQDEKYN